MIWSGRASRILMAIVTVIVLIAFLTTAFRFPA
ncbi:hypothetical protein BH18CHL1_BH18CHL1_03190 [soil metagenome]